LAVLTAQNGLAKRNSLYSCSLFLRSFCSIFTFWRTQDLFWYLNELFCFLLSCKLHTATKKGTGFTTTAVLFLLCLLRIRNVG